jgi:protein involved in polysaccharide export with SLBB domain
MMKYFHPLLIAATLWLLPATLLAQAKQPVTPVAPPQSVGSETDILTSQDVLDIQIGNHSELDQSAVVNQDGKVTLREFGQFMAAGKTRAALQNEIQVQADKTLNNAPVYLTMRERHAERIAVDGGVQAPGVYPLTPGMRVLDAISAAHGLVLKPNRYTLKLIRNDKGQALNVSKIYVEPETEANPVLKPNDKLVFNEIDLIRHRVTVLGQVMRPSTYIVDGDSTVLTLLTDAGGLSPAAALTQVFVERGTTKIPLDLRPILVKGTVDEPVLHFRFEDGDVLSIPGVETKYQVLGQVVRPASYVFPEKANITVLDALAAAGGQTQKANLNKAYILRTESGKAKEIKVDFNSLNKKGLASANLPLQPGDILVIPERGKPGITLGDALAPLSILNLLGFRIL